MLKNACICFPRPRRYQGPDIEQGGLEAHFHSWRNYTQSHGGCSVTSCFLCPPEVESSLCLAGALEHCHLVKSLLRGHLHSCPQNPPSPRCQSLVFSS
jgi:hypothetical protein